MMRRANPNAPPLTGTSPAAAGTAQILLITGLAKFDAFTLDVLVQGATGGTLSLAFQRLIDPAYNAGAGLWADWALLTQLAAAAAKELVSLTFQLGGTPSAAFTTLGIWTTAVTGTQVIAAGAVAPIHPGDQLRLVGTAGAGTSAGAAASVYVSGFERLT